MASQKENLKKLDELRSQVLGQIERLNLDIERLKAQLSGIELSIRAMGGDAKWSSNVTSFSNTNLNFRNVINHPRSNIKNLILTLLKEAGAEGINATMIVERAAQRNVVIGKSTASSLLSRYKAQGLTHFDGGLYRLNEENNKTRTGETNAS